jgi:hypothetical protein
VSVAIRACGQARTDNKLLFLYSCAQIGLDIGGGAAKNIPQGYPKCFLECAAVQNII